MSWQVMPDFSSYRKAREQFTWDLPDSFNPARDFLRNHSDPGPEDRVALIDAVSEEQYTFADIDRLSGQLANALADSGIEKGDRIGVIAPQRVETPTTHIAAWRLGAVSVPMTTMYGENAISYRTSDAELDAIIFDPIVADDVEAATSEYDGLDVAIQLNSHPWYVGSGPSNYPDLTVNAPTHTFDEFVSGYSDKQQIVEATPETDSTIMYTSGSTGPPKGVLHGHGLWLGRAAAAHNFFNSNLSSDNINWTPADWAWASALGGLLMGSWHHGTTVVAAPMQGFDPDSVFDLCETYEISNALIPPTALRMLMDADPTEYDLALQTIASAGEPLTPEILDWAEQNFDNLAVNEYYGQTELNLVISNSSRWFDVKPGSMGKPLPGYDVTIRDPETHEKLPPGEVGEIAVKPQDDRVFFKKYLDRPDATANKEHNGWYLTDDHAKMDENGYVWFESRADDVIITSGYRVGPLEVERVLLEHPDVEQAGVIGVPDEKRGEIIKAHVKLASDVAGDENLRSELQELAKGKLAKHEYPREIEFTDSLPMTSSGKIQRVKLRELEEKERSTNIK
ncbi:AMP-binding protein [Salinarchaeum sp. IM2453]|uniref:acyl-CoA synthetase n=1 Tax=Salinarchaeum sp. IM2453 TaxID=2862870 RepID=UPI001C838254|nr:AMP-binding protein [Salinarchaeum sp. IM2453]QZA88550.1 AMP-binding protein [Salinarchaeum sp. IM2453]